MSDDYVVREMLEALGKAAAQGKADAVIGLIVPRLVRAADALETRFDYLPPLGPGAKQRGDDGLLLDYAEALLAALLLSREQGSTLDNRMAALDPVQEPLRLRLAAAHLHQAQESPDAVAEFLVDQIANRRPTPEALVLLRDVADVATPDLVARLSSALGDPPSVTDIARQPLEERFPSDWIRTHSWLVAMPAAVKERWRDASALFNARLGPAPSDGRLIGDFQVMTGPGSPIGRAELSAVSVEDAATRIGEWEPTGDQTFGPSPRGLERELQEVVKGNPSAWAADPIGVVTRLRHPTYVYGYFQGLCQVADEVTGSAGPIAQAVLVVDAEPWAVAEMSGDPFDADTDWTGARAAGVELLRKLWDASADMGTVEPDALAIVSAAARRWDDQSGIRGDSVDPLTAAINRPSTRALDAALSWAMSRVRRDESWSPPTDLLGLLEDWLRRPGLDGLEGRAIIATKLPFLREYAGDWFQANRSLIIGGDAPDDLGRRTFDLYVEWARPTRTLLSEEVEAYALSLNSQADHAVAHLLLGLLWGVPPWDDSGYLLATLLGESVETVSLAGDALARMLREVDDEQVVNRGLALWKSAVEAHLPPEAYKGFGWFAEVDAVSPNDWLDLMSATVDLSGGTIEWEHRVAKRAAASPSDERALRILTRLITGDMPMWHVRDVGAAALLALEESRDAELPDATEAARERLVETLLERGFFEARELAR